MLYGGMLFLMSPLIYAQGKVLHDSSCLECHASLTGGQPNHLYIRSDRKVTTVEALEKRVIGCSAAADANWSPAQRQQVVEYLAETFYQF
jgi:mono/diheme cytochrome c family protein